MVITTETPQWRLLKGRKKKQITQEWMGGGLLLDYSGLTAFNNLNLMAAGISPTGLPLIPVQQILLQLFIKWC